MTLIIALSSAWLSGYSSSVALTTRPNLIKSLQRTFPRGMPFDHHQLAKLRVSSALAHYYLKSGWLARDNQKGRTFRKYSQLALWVAVTIIITLAATTPVLASQSRELLKPGTAAGCGHWRISFQVG